ncbi:hypothetical protein GQ42DRAFT_79039 [Ramicandelaber brevisporus]|nr:hypothetical protein GQ42DRAFT_79039 [Ramicandelaber brevisporus]
MCEIESTSACLSLCPSLSSSLSLSRKTSTSQSGIVPSPALLLHVYSVFSHCAKNRKRKACWSWREAATEAERERRRETRSCTRVLAREKTGRMTEPRCQHLQCPSKQRICV